MYSTKNCVREDIFYDLKENSRILPLTSGYLPLCPKVCFAQVCAEENSTYTHALILFNLSNCGFLTSS